MVMPDPLDLYGLKRAFARTNELGDLLRETADPAFLRRARRALLPIPWIEHPRAVENPLRRRPAARPVPALMDKRVAVIATGGGGACVSLIGVARAFEEAGIRPASLTACSGGAIWGAMWAAGLSAYDMARFSLITTIVYNMDLGRVEYFGTRRTPELTIGELVRVAIALPVFIEAVPVGDHVYVDGGIIELFPAEPVLEEGGYDHVFGVNFKLPAQFEPQDITGWYRHRL
jgi:NTE family protein